MDVDYTLDEPKIRVKYHCDHPVLFANLNHSDPPGGAPLDSSNPSDKDGEARPEQPNVPIDDSSDQSASVDSPIIIHSDQPNITILSD